MTLSEGITLVLKRVGLSSTADEFRDQAREYINLIMAEHAPLVPWWFLNRTTTFDTVADTRVYSPVSGNVTEWYSFTNETDDRLLEIIGPDEYDWLDPNRSEKGSVYTVYIGGVDATTGYPTVELYRIPSGVETIRVRYQLELGGWTSSNDASEFSVLGVPRIVESILIYGAASLYMEENGDDSGAAREAGNLTRVIEAAKKQNIRMQGNRRYLPQQTAGSYSLIRVDNSLAVP